MAGILGMSQYEGLEELRFIRTSKLACISLRTESSRIDSRSVVKQRHGST